MVEDFVNTVQQAGQDHRAKELQFTEKYYDFLNREAVNMAGCDQTCVNGCTDSNTYTLQQVPQCIIQCSCEGGVIRLEDGQVTTAQVSYYAKKNPSTLAYFKKYYPY